MNFKKKLDAIVKKNNSLACIGLDPDYDRLPEHIKKKKNPQFEFNKAIINATHDLVCCYKPNSAFYEAYGDRGVKELKMTCEYIQKTYPEIPIIIDAKRGDIGNTNNGYAKFIVDYLAADAVTVIPYLGIEALSPFFRYPGLGIIIACHSSNSGSKEFQELLVGGKLLFHIVAEEIVKQYCGNPYCMIFMCATYPEELGPI